jgi:hypothetical protein
MTNLHSGAKQEMLPSEVRVVQEQLRSPDPKVQAEAAMRIAALGTEKWALLHGTLQEANRLNEKTVENFADALEAELTKTLGRNERWRAPPYHCVVVDPGEGEVARIALSSIDDFEDDYSYSGRASIAIRNVDGDLRIVCNDPGGELEPGVQACAEQLLPGLQQALQ